ELLPCGLIRVNQDEILPRPLEVLRQSLDRFDQDLPGPDGLREHRERAEGPASSEVLAGGDDLDGDVPGIEIAVEPLQDPPAVDVGERDIEGDGRWPELAGQAQ